MHVDRIVRLRQFILQGRNRPVPLGQLLSQLRFLLLELSGGEPGRLVGPSQFLAERIDLGFGCGGFPLRACEEFIHFNILPSRRFGRGQNVHLQCLDAGCGLLGILGGMIPHLVQLHPQSGDVGVALGEGRREGRRLRPTLLQSTPEVRSGHLEFGSERGNLGIPLLLTLGLVRSDLFQLSPRRLDVRSQSLDRPSPLPQYFVRLGFEP
mmetsp:Transcript_38065/g.113666  ORF Transcript_38065/g.113666 Transcript_38065/m.113666 type:complete len:209 (+) Transcript_38065:1437-2063(+)